MKVNEKFKVKVLQEGGQMPATEAAGGTTPADPLVEILQVATQAVQNNDCQAGLAVCAALIQMAQGGGGGEQAPAEPVMARKGGKLVLKKRV